jgi:hypothetical protein
VSADWLQVPRNSNVAHSGLTRALVAGGAPSREAERSIGKYGVHGKDLTKVDLLLVRSAGNVPPKLLVSRPTFTSSPPSEF